LEARDLDRERMVAVGEAPQRVHAHAAFVVAREEIDLGHEDAVQEHARDAAVDAAVADPRDGVAGERERGASPWHRRLRGRASAPRGPIAGVARNPAVGVADRWIRLLVAPRGRWG